MRKKQLIEQLNRSNERIRQLEDLICPAESHDWKVYTSSTDYDPDLELFTYNHFGVCNKCRKRRIISNTV